MPRKPALHHLRLDVTAQAQLQADAPLPPLPPHGLLHPRTQADHMPQPIRRPAQEGLQLPVRRGRGGLGKVHRHPQTRGPGLPEHGREHVHRPAGVAGRPSARVTAEIKADDPAPREAGAGRPGLRAEGGRDAEGLGRVLGGIAPVDAQNQPGVEGQGLGGLELPGVDGSEDGADVGFLGEEDGAVCGEGAARGGAELEVDGAVGGEVGEDGAGCVCEGGGVGEEGVDVA